MEVYCDVRTWLVDASGWASSGEWSVKSLFFPKRGNARNRQTDNRKETDTNLKKKKERTKLKQNKSKFMQINSKRQHK